MTRRGRGEGSLSKYVTSTGRARWRAQWWEPEDPADARRGKRQRSLGGFETREAARDALLVQLTGIEPQSASLHRANSPSFSTYADSWLARYLRADDEALHPSGHRRDRPLHRRPTDRRGHSRRSRRRLPGTGGRAATAAPNVRREGPVGALYRLPLLRLDRHDRQRGHRGRLAQPKPGVAQECRQTPRPTCAPRQGPRERSA